MKIHFYVAGQDELPAYANPTKDTLKKLFLCTVSRTALNL